MRQTLVAGNWKMNGSKESAKALLDGLLAGIGGIARTEMAVCPPFPYLQLAQDVLAGSALKLGAQNVSGEEGGAFTGEVAASMLTDFGCTYVICGHSERRALYGETDAAIAKKIEMTVAQGMTPILCVGETLEERESGDTENVIAGQIDGIINASGVDIFAKLEIAYEPVWAIGTGKTATPEQAQDVHAFIRGRLASRNGEIAEKVRILYGGSMKPGNAAELLSQPDIDGGLIGGASLKAEDFLAIGKAGDDSVA